MEKILLPCFIDCEASSLDADSYPTEIGWSLPDGEIKSILINPYSQEDWTDWDFHAQQLTGISRKLLREEGHHPFDVATTLNADLKGITVYSDAVDFDGRWCRKLFEAVELKMEFDIKHFWLAFKGLVDNEKHMWELIFDAEKRLGSCHRAAVDVELSPIAYQSLFGA